jgi:hypothetical protein
LNSVGESVLQIAPNAAAAYSLRSLTGGDPKVVRVRRDTDNAEQDFTASGISSGALVDFATSGNGVFANTGYESFTNASASGFTASNTGSTGFAVSDILDGVSGDAVLVSFDIDITNGSPSISLRNALSGGAVASNSVNYTSSGSKTATLTATGSYVGVGFTEGDAPSSFTVSNFKVLGNGFVETWYDQSGNGRNAVQATAGSQPKIVNSGSLVVLSGVPALSFDGSSDLFTVTGFAFSPSGDFLAVTVSKISNGNLIDTRDGGGDGFFLQQGSTFRHRYNGDGAINISGNDQHIVATSELNGTTLTAYKNGASAGTDTVTAGLSTTTNTTIGRVSFTAVNYVAGSIQEIILYDADKSANRATLETNIINHYGIS